MNQTKSLRIRRWSAEAIIYQIVFLASILITGYFSDAWMAVPVTIALSTTFIRLKFGSPLFYWQLINVLVSSGIGIWIGN